MPDSDLVQNLLAASPSAVARAITRVERGGQDARDLVRAIFSFTGKGYIVGVTGAPGTGKSTLVNELAKEYKRRGRSVGIIAVDPSSPFSGGAILGDRLRMQDLSGTGIFIRSMAARGHLGGLAAGVADSVTVLDAAGFDVIFVETVGAGQGEVEIAKNADTTLVLESPGLGDEIQAIKAGIIEIADVLIVNKADRDGADATAAALEMNLSLTRETRGPADRAGYSEWVTPVLKTIATRGEGIGSAVDAIERHKAFLELGGRRAAKLRARIENELVDLIQRELYVRAMTRLPEGHFSELVAKVASREMDVYTAAERITEGQMSTIA